MRNILLGVFIFLLLFIAVLRALDLSIFPEPDSYTIPANESLVIHNINKFKRLNLEFAPPDSFLVSDNWSTGKNIGRYYAFFYLSESNELLVCWLARNDSGGTTLNLIGYIKGASGELNGINGTLFHVREYVERKKKFREKILAPIKKELGLK
jgi:hypothetical protein